MASVEPLHSNESGGEIRSPLIWLIVGDRLGDNAQVETLVSRLDVPVTRKYVRVLERYARTKPRVRPSLHHLDMDRSDSLEPPWPDMVITIGRRLSMVALWIKKQSGGRTKIVYIGKPSGYFHACDLIIASAETQIPPASNVMKIALPLLRVDEGAVAEAAEEWRQRLAALPRPLIGILIGGPTNPFVFNRQVTERMLDLARDIIERDGGTPYFTTSPRTPKRTIDALREGLPAGAQFFEWHPGATDNPYKGLLGLADGFIVTGDSISMLVEVAKLGKPLAIFTLPLGWFGRLDQVRRRLARWLYDLEGDSALDRWRRGAAVLGHRVHIMPQTRDFTSLHGRLVDQGLAVYAGSALRKSSGTMPDDNPSVLARIKTLLSEADR